MNDKIVNLPSHFIGKEDEQKLESYGAHLISHGYATRYHWKKENGIIVAFEVYRGGADEEFLFAIRRNQEGDYFFLEDANGAHAGRGTLEHVMAVGDDTAKVTRGDAPA